MTLSLDTTRSLQHSNESSSNQAYEKLLQLIDGGLTPEESEEFKKILGETFKTLVETIHNLELENKTLSNKIEQLNREKKESMDQLKQLKEAIMAAKRRLQTSRSLNEKVDEVIQKNQDLKNQLNELQEHTRFNEGSARIFRPWIRVVCYPWSVMQAVMKKMLSMASWMISQVWPISKG